MGNLLSDFEETPWPEQYLKDKEEDEIKTQSRGRVRAGEQAGRSRGS